MSNKISYNESVIPHSLVCIDGGSGTIPADYMGYDFDIPNDFSGTNNALDLYLHAIEINGTFYFYPPAVTNPTTPILTFGNQSAIQSFLNSSLVSSGFSANDLIFVVNPDNTITIWVSPSYTIGGNEFWMGTSVPDNYTNKYFPVIPTTHSFPGGKTQAQLVKYKTSTGVIIDKFYSIGLNPTEIVLNGSEIITPGICVIDSPINNPITDIVGPSSTFTVTTNYFSISYVVIGDNGTIQTPHNGVTRPLFDGESGEFKADDGDTLDNTIIFTTGLNTNIIINAIVRI